MRIEINEVERAFLLELLLNDRDALLAEREETILEGGDVGDPRLDGLLSTGEILTARLEAAGAPVAGTQPRCATDG